MRNRRWSIIVLFFASLAAAPLASRAEEPLTFYGFDEATYSETARLGMKEILAGNCFHAGIPLRAAMTVARINTNSTTDTKPSPPATRLETASVMPSPPGRKAGMMPGMPLNASVLRRNGVVLVNGNCFGCHAGVVNGQVVAGLGNNNTDQATEFTRAQSILNGYETILAEMKTDAEKKELSDFVGHVRSAVSVFQFARTRGDNFGPYAVWRLGARFIDPRTQGMNVGTEKTELEKLLESIELPTVDPMPWWLMKYKKTDYWYSDAGPDDAVHFSVNFTTAHPEANESRATHIDSVAKALAFARETQSPPFPRTLDPQLVQRGADLFHGRTRPANAAGFTACKNCHGTYTRKASASDPTKPGSWEVAYNYSTVLRNVHTDSAYNDTLQKLKPIAQHIESTKEYFDSKGTPELSPKVSVPAKSGYVAPPLVGVWATAPYFHNGSVPTVEAVLNSAERPEIWARTMNDPQTYDLERVGLEYRPVTREEYSKLEAETSNVDSSSQASADKRAHYDTTLFGRHNTGHPFGDNLTKEERRAVIEFLKSLSGPDM